MREKMKMEKMKINHISISREGTWQECKKKYHYRYHLDMIPSVEPIYFLYGKVVHKIIETYTRAKGTQDINEITKNILSGDILLEEEVKNDAGTVIKPSKKVTGPLPADYRQKLPVHLTNFMKLNKCLGFDGEIEWKFDYDLDPPNKRILTGFIDRLILKPDKCIIVDYKTTKPGPWRKNKRTIGGDLQLQCYARMAQVHFGYKAEQITAALYFLDGEFLPTQFSQQTIDGVEKRLLSVYKEIQATDADTVQGTVGKHCYRCDYSHMCPYFRMI